MSDPYYGELEGRRYLRKARLKDGAYYQGHCRNAGVARWDAKANVFTYWRTKFGSTFTETINHPEDDNGFDLFFPEGDPLNISPIPTPNHPVLTEEQIKAKLDKLAEWFRGWQLSTNDDVGGALNEGLNVAISQLYDPQENREVLELLGVIAA